MFHIIHFLFSQDFTIVVLSVNKLCLPVKIRPPTSDLNSSVLMASGNNLHYPNAFITWVGCNIQVSF